MIAQQGLDLSAVSGNKFHTLCYELGVAFEMTFPTDTKITYSSEFAFPDLVYKNNNVNAEAGVKVHCPAISTGDLKTDKKVSICFVPWVTNDEDVLFHRICLRAQPLSRHTSVYRSMAFARFGEEKAFSFDLKRRGGNFINLQFLGYGTQEFNPLYVKVGDNGSHFYYKISAIASEECVTVEIEEVSAGDCPPSLQKVTL